MNHHVIYDTVHRASAALAALYREANGSDHLKAMHGDSLPIGLIPLVTQGQIGDVSLEGLGPAYYQVECHRLLEAANLAIKAVGNAKGTSRLMKLVYPQIDTRALQKLHAFAPLVHLAVHYSNRMNGQVTWDPEKQQLIVNTQRLKLRIDGGRAECNGYVRRSDESVPAPDLIVSRSSGHATRTFPNLGAVYRAVAIQLPELSQATKLLITVAYLADVHHLITDKFDIERCNDVARNRIAWTTCHDAVVKSPTMPWRALHTQLRDLVDPATFRREFNTEISWVNYQYRVHHRERHMASLLAMQTQDLHAQKFPTLETEDRRKALQLLQLQQQVR